MERTRAVIYASDEGADRQIAAAMRYVQDHDYEIVGTAEGEGGWISAHVMLASREADVIVFASRRYLPSRLESVSGELRNPLERRPRRLR